MITAPTTFVRFPYFLLPILSAPIRHPPYVRMAMALFMVRCDPFQPHAVLKFARMRNAASTTQCVPVAIVPIFIR